MKCRDNFCNPALLINLIFPERCRVTEYTDGGRGESGANDYVLFVTIGSLQKSVENGFIKIFQSDSGIEEAAYIL